MCIRDRLICEQIAEPKIQESASLDSTARGSCGFGSTGGTRVADNYGDENLLLEIEKFLTDF